MLLASHNSWSYASPAKWWLRPFHFMARCQSRNIKEQYQAGARLFDIRFRFRDDGTPVVCHGVIPFETTYETDLAWLSAQEGPVSVRVILETSDEDVYQEHCFKRKCKSLQEAHPRLTFFGGQRKSDWVRIYTFPTPDPVLTDRYSSTTSLFPDSWKGRFWRICDDWWPWLYAKLYNGRNLKEWEGKEGVLFLDFL